MLGTILIVDDSEMNRMILGRILCEEYEILYAENGRTAMNILIGNHESISAVMLDLIMPVMDGYEVLTKMRQTPELAQIPVIVTTGDDEKSTEIKALDLGANDIILKPYHPTVIRCRLRNLIKMIENTAYVNSLKYDALTGLYNRAAFFRRVSEMVAAQKPGYYTIASFDVNNFKAINDQYGNVKGDEVLRMIGQTFSDGFAACGGFCCRINADVFATLYPTYFGQSEEIVKIREKAAVLDGTVLPLTFNIGRYVIENTNLSPSAMYDRAVIAQNSIKGRIDMPVAYYEEKMRTEILREREITGEMRQALESKQFVVWLQPQYNHATGALIGSEALVRWNHPTKGIIYPGSFIPVFEKNGFVSELDKFVWEQVCVILSGWISEGRNPLPISVNISRYDIFRDDVVGYITSLVEKYGIPIELLRLEITESAFTSSSDRIIETVKSFVNIGFTVEIDDFGSGYSSLNTLKDVPAHIVKLDMRFLEDTKGSDRGGNIVESVVRMTRWLGMSVIAEGVETVEQAEYLKTIGCCYVQGYLYSKPVTVEQFEKLTLTATRESRLSTVETVETMDNNAFWNPVSMDTIIFNTYVGGACIFEWHNGNLEMLRVNDKYMKAVFGESATIYQVLRMNWRDHMDEENYRITSNAIKETIRTLDDATFEIECQNLPGIVGKSYLRTTLRVIARVEDRYLIYATSSNITAEYEATQQLSTIMSNINAGVCAAVIDSKGNLCPVFANEMYYRIYGYTKAQFENEVESILDTIYPEDRDRALSQIIRIISQGKKLVSNHRSVKRDGSVIHVSCNNSVVSMAGIAEKVILTVTTDITKLIQMQQNEHTLSDKLRLIMSGMASGVSAVTFGDEGVIDYIFVNEKYYSLHGFTEAQYKNEVVNPYMLIEPEDREAVITEIGRLTKSKEATPLEYRVKRRDGAVIWLRCMLSLTEISGIDKPILLGIYTDITEKKKTEARLRNVNEQLRFLNDTARNLLSENDAELGIMRVLKETLDYFGAGRAFIYEFDWKRDLCTNTYSLRAEGEVMYNEKYRSFPLEKAWFWINSFKEKGYIYIDGVSDIGEERKIETTAYEALGIHKALAVSLHTGDKLTGTIGVFNPTKHIDEYENLTALGDYIAVIISRREMNAKIESDRTNLLDMLEDMPGGFARIRMDSDENVGTLFVNRVFCEYRKMNSADILKRDGENAYNAVHPDDVPGVREAVKKMAATGKTSSIVYRVLRSDGSYIPLHAFCRVTRDRGGAVFLNVYYAELEDGEKADYTVNDGMRHFLSGIMAFSDDLAFVKDSSFRYICCTPAFAKMTGRSDESEVTGKTDYDLFEKQIADKYRSDDLKLFKNGVALVNYRESIPSADDIRRYSDTSKFIIRDGKGKIIGLYGIGRDITEYKHTAERLKLITESMPGGIASYIIENGRYRLTYCNDGFFMLHGYTAEEFDRTDKSDIRELVYAEDIGKVTENIKALCERDVPLNCVYRTKIKSGCGGFRRVNLRGSVTDKEKNRYTLNIVLYDIT